ncbi:ATP-dependent helicase [Anaerobacillus alkalidiazotrophicus]|uniref:ATP-dependent helicase n=1 Tax=Anaerobacillus alkalidiazotrophicus TaxID=472963 RepID=A0A1S2M630_9BACI|nr:ATP-dependent DNA helicase [Anaerobacillus alkalidiazotrophicus]OIJ20084.1 ATP-dependent helicase [Anaerobacillus alkalidiazotrophicus]
MQSFEKLPFTYDRKKSFIEQLGDWVGDVFYDILPEAGFEIRDEQIFMAYQLERSFAEKKVIFAEAGVGTGKTIAYLLYAICYARYVGKPAIIACADEALIEQLVKPEGDIAKISKVLNLNIDVRLAKAQSQYLCVQKLEKLRDADENPDVYGDVYQSVPSFVYNNVPMQEFHFYGDRKTYSKLDNETWGKINWDAFQDCSVCEKRHRCGMTLTREHYRKATDLIVCSQDFYMEHIWTQDSRKRKGQLPFLPEASSIVFDEGHLLEIAAQKALAYYIRHDLLEEILERLLENDVREEVAVYIDEIISQSLHLFTIINKNSSHVKGSDRHDLEITSQVINEIKEFRRLLTALEDALVFESELYTIEDYQLKIVEEHIEMLQYALSLLEEKTNVVTWVTKEEGVTTLVIMPNLVEDVLREKVFSKKLPMVFSSATLSTNGNFHYIAGSLGIKDYLSFTVESPFDYKNHLKVFIPNIEHTQKVNSVIEVIEKSEGRALLLFNTEDELLAFKEIAKTDERLENYQFLFEGDQELSSLVHIFQNLENTCLCAIHLWEGLDVPGRSLSSVIIWSLPFPPNDPVFNGKRKNVKNPYNDVDLPYMLLRLRQGIGRLIRTSTDEGIVAIVDHRLSQDKDMLEVVKSTFPIEVEVNSTLDN